MLLGNQLNSLYTGVVVTRFVPAFSHILFQLTPQSSEIKIISEFLPKQLSEEETKKICLETMKKVGASSVKDMGKVMGALKKEYSDVLDFSKVSQIIKENFK